MHPNANDRPVARETATFAWGATKFAKFKTRCSSGRETWRYPFYNIIVIVVIHVFMFNRAGSVTRFSVANNNILATRKPYYSKRVSAANVYLYL
jgi:hypothetical protein